MKSTSKYKHDPVSFSFQNISQDLSARWCNYRYMYTWKYWQQTKQQEWKNNSNEYQRRNVKSLETLLSSHFSLSSFRALICYCRMYTDKWCTSSYSDSDTWNQFTYIKITFPVICFHTISSGSSHIKAIVIWYTKWRDLRIIFQEVFEGELLLEKPISLLFSEEAPYDFCYFCHHRWTIVQSQGYALQTETCFHCSLRKT